MYSIGEKIMYGGTGVCTVQEITSVKQSGLDRPRLYYVLKPLYHKAMEGLRLVPTAFSPANLAAMSDSKIRQERMNSIRTQAKELLKPPTVKVMIHGVPELIDL